MHGRQPARPGRSLVAASAALLLCGLAVRAFELTGAAALDAVSESGPDAPADLLVLGAAGIGLLLVLWLGVGFLLAILGTLPGGVGRFASVAADRVSPPLARRAAALVLGTTLVATGTPLAAHAAEPPPAPTTSVQVTVPPAPDPAFGVTTRTSGLGPLGSAPRPTASPPETVTVTRGDSLWAIAARHLGPGATRQQIAREWPRWYAANRGAIGPNPDLIRAGLVLTAPEAAS
ncbi:MAG TPA: LysM domain-containing protein [Lapillicoccus sp.]|nr:LysM domain-containing protein [Lapillicoccus sp.]